MAGLNFDITGNNDDLRRKLQESRNAIINTANVAEKQGSKIEQTFKRLGSAMIAGVASQEVISKIVKIRGEFQQLEIAFTTMLKSEDRATKLMGQLTKFAAETPFGLQSASSGAKQLIAYGSAAEDVIDELTMLGDVAAGTGQQIGDLVYLYGTLRMQGRAYTTDIRQFAGRGIPIYKELAEVLGVAEDKVNDLVTSGKVGFKEVEQAFKNMTASGSMYGGLMDAQSKSVTGRIEQLSDAMDMMFNKIGKNNEGVIYGAIGTTAELVENYEEVGKIILELVAVYGSYRAALIIVTALQNANTIAMRANAITGSNLNAVNVLLGRNVKALSASFATLNKTMLANPYALVAAAVVALGYGFYKLATSQTESEKAQKRLNEVTEDYNKSVKSEEINIEILFGRLKNAKEGTEEYQKAKDNIISKYGKYLKGLNSEIEALQDVEGAYRAISKAAIQAAKDRAIERGTQSAVDNYTDQWGKNIEKIQEAFVDKFGESQGTLFMDSLKESLSSGEAFNKDLQDAIKQFDHTIREGTLSNKTNFVEERIKDIRKSKGLLDKEVKDLESIFGKPTQKESEKPKEEAPVPLYSVDYKAAQKEWNEAKKALEAIGKDKGKFTTKQYNEAKEREETAKKAFEALGGVTKVDKTSQKAGLDANRLKSETADRLREIEEARKRILSQEKDNEIELQQERINLMKDGADKALAQIKLDYDKRVAEIARKGQELVKQQQEIERKIWEMENPNAKDKGLSFAPNSTSVEHLPENDRKYLVESYELANKERLKAETDYQNELLEKYHGYLEKRKTVDEKYAKERKELEKAGASQETLGEFDYQREEALKAIDEQFAMREEEFRAWANSIADMSIKQLQVMLEKANQELKRMEKDNPSNPKLASTRAKISKLNTEISNEKVNTSPGERSIKEWQGLYKVLDKVSDQFGDIGREVGGVAGEIISVAGEVASSTLQIINGIVTVVNSSSSAMQGTAAAAATSISTVEKASVILAVIGAALQIATKIAGMFGPDNSNYEAAKENYEDYLSVLDDIIEKQLELIDTMTGKAALEASEKALDLINKQVEAARELGKLYLNTNASAGSHSFGYRNWEKYSKNDWEQLRELDGDIYRSVYNNGDKRMTGLFDLTVEQLKTLKEELPTFWAKLDDQTREYLETVIEGQKRLDEIQQRLQESLTQTTFDSIYDNFLELLTDMESGTEDFATNFEEMMKKAILNSMLAEKYKKELQKWYDNFAKANEDNYIGSDEYQQLQDEYNRIVQNAIAERDQLKDLLKWGGDTESSQQSSRSGYQTLSEDTGLALEGRFAAIQMTGEELKIIAGIIQLDILELKSIGASINITVLDIRDIALDSVWHLEKISKNTEQLYILSEKLDRIEKNTREL